MITTQDLELKKLKKALNRKVMDVRKRGNLTLKKTNPRYIEIDEIIRSDGRRLFRMKVILMSNGCSIPTCTMCPFTNENNYNNKEQSNNNLIEQVRSVLSPQGQISKCQQVALYNDGSFFSPQEIPNPILLEIGKLVSQSGIEVLTVESLPQFITKERLLPFLEVLGNVKLEVGIGLQSSNDIIREYCVNTSFSIEEFERSIDLLNSNNVQVKTYLMLKPPFLSEEEGVEDALTSMNYCIMNGLNYVTICPTRVSRNTLAWELLKSGYYKPPNLWSIVDVLNEQPKNLTTRIACINLKGTDFEAIYPDSCPKCAGSLIEALENFSLSNDLNDLPKRCECAPKPFNKLNSRINNDKIIQSISATLSEINI